MATADTIKVLAKDLIAKTNLEPRQCALPAVELATCMSRDCPEKRKPKCHNCGGPHTLDKCTSDSWDTDRIFENKRIERERYAKRNKSEPEPVKPLASLILKVTDLKGTAASIETYDQPCVRATGYCRAMAQCALQNYSAQHSARYGSGSWVCNPMS